MKFSLHTALIIQQYEYNLLQCANSFGSRCLTVQSLFSALRHLPLNLLNLHIAHFISLRSIHCSVLLIVDGLKLPKQFIHPRISGLSISAIMLSLHPVLLWISIAFILSRDFLDEVLLTEAIKLYLLFPSTTIYLWSISLTASKKLPFFTLDVYCFECISQKIELSKLFVSWFCPYPCSTRFSF